MRRCGADEVEIEDVCRAVCVGIEMGGMDAGEELLQAANAKQWRAAAGGSQRAKVGRLSR